MNAANLTKPLAPLRSVIAARMTEAEHTAPPAGRGVADGSAARARESEPNEPVSSRLHQRLHDQACAIAPMKHRLVKSQLVDDEIHLYSDVDISVVVGVEGGVSTPIILGANRKVIYDIANEIRQLAARAAADQLQMSENVGGSFSISNLGSLDEVQFDAIINPPQCAVLALGRIGRNVTMDESGAVRSVSILCATLPIDHRAIDGVIGAAFLGTLQKILQQPKQIFASKA